VHPCTEALREKIQRGNRHAHYLLYFLGGSSALSARRIAAQWHEQYKPVQERLASESNAVIDVLEMSKNGGYAQI
jgi:hypothetical protein